MTGAWRIRSASADSPALAEVIARWESRRPASVSAHEHAPCQEARQWLLTMDISRRVEMTAPPIWIRDLFRWGPTEWPLHWCQLPTLPQLDCGGLAAVAEELISVRGAVAVPAEFIQRFSERDIAHWTSTWRASNAETDWMHPPFVYHEGVALLDWHGGVRLWDPTDNLWLDPVQEPGYGSTAAVRLDAGPRLSGYIGSHLRWGAHVLIRGSWTPIGSFEGTPTP